MRRRWEPADTVAALATALLVVVFAVFAFLVWQGYNSTLVQAQKRASNAAGIIAAETQWVISTAIALLTDLEAHLGGDASRLTAAQRETFLEATAALPAKVLLAVYDANGNVVANGASERLPQSVADTGYFAALAGGQEWEVSGQGFVTDAEPMFAITKRLNSGEVFTGVAVITISASVVETLWARQELGEDSTVSVVRRDGWVIARYPPLTEPLNVAQLPIFETLSSIPAGSYESDRSPVDGVSRIIAFQQVPDVNVVALAGISRDAVLDALWSATRTVLLLMAPIAVALFGGSLLTSRLLRQSERDRRSLAAALAHNEVLFREIHHRVKNNLQSVASLLQLQPIPREVKLEMGQRIAAMSAVHEHIYRSSSFSTVHVREYLKTLIENIRAGQDPNVRVIEEVEDLAVDKDSATPLGLIINEVVSNAFKHAFKDGRQGVVTVRLVREGDSGGLLQVEDNGVGFDPVTPSKGIGRRLIAALSEQMAGEASFSSGAVGSRFTLTFPLAKPASAA